MTLTFNILTLFPDMFPGSLGQSLAGKALERGDWGFKTVNIRDFAQGVHKSVDDTPYGGGAGMVMRADIIERALLSVPAPGRKIYLSPRGKPLTQGMVKTLSRASDITLLCGRYEGVDQRLLDAYDFEEISIGDYVLSGGEPAALILMDACIRLLPGVMGNDDTPLEESFSNGLLEYPHYTRPAVWEAECGQALEVPDVLRSGNHQNIKEWRAAQSLEITQKQRPDLYEVLQEDKKFERRGSLHIDHGKIDEICKEIVDASIFIHKQLGPGLLENIYEIFLFQELQKRCLSVQRQVSIPVQIDERTTHHAFRADLIVENHVLIELKAVEKQLPVHKAQVISYLKLTNLPVGFLINFNVPLLKDGIRRFQNR